MSKILTAGKYAEIHPPGHGGRLTRRVSAGREGLVGGTVNHSFVGHPPATTRKGRGQGVVDLGRAFSRGSQTGRTGRTGEAPAILVPNRKQMLNWGEFMWRELREGGVLKRYLEKERATSLRRQRAVAQKWVGFKQNTKSDMELVAAIPGREYQRWKAEDKHFFEDDKNLKSLKRDNPEMAIFI